MGGVTFLNGRVRRPEAGFSIVDMLVTVALIGTMAAIAAPAISNVTDGIKLGQAARGVERELQAARLKAVTSNRPIRVRFNCPVNGSYRLVELIGSASAPDPLDASTTRCQEASYPVPAGDNNPITRPNHDGATRVLPDDVTFGSAPTLEFWPDGSVHKQAAAENPWASLTVSGTAVTLIRDDNVKKVTVNGLGKISLVD
jgi:type II secretory pathway pseudopilin PulG